MIDASPQETTGILLAAQNDDAEEREGPEGPEGPEEPEGRTATATPRPARTRRPRKGCLKKSAPAAATPRPGDARGPTAPLPRVAGRRRPRTPRERGRAVGVLNPTPVCRRRPDPPGKSGRRARGGARRPGAEIRVHVRLQNRAPRAKSASKPKSRSRSKSKLKSKSKSRSKSKSVAGPKADTDAAREDEPRTNRRKESKKPAGASGGEPHRQQQQQEVPNAPTVRVRRSALGGAPERSGEGEGGRHRRQLAPPPLPLAKEPSPRLPAGLPNRAPNGAPTGLPRIAVGIRSARSRRQRGRDPRSGTPCDERRKTEGPGPGVGKRDEPERPALAQRGGWTQRHRAQGAAAGCRNRGESPADALAPDRRSHRRQHF